MEIDPSYLEDASGFRGFADRLLIPEHELELAGVLAEASRQRTPVTIAGGGTGVTGGRVALGGWVISTEKLRRLEICGDHALAGAGVPLKDLHAAASAAGRLYAPDPTETWATVGGTVATNASGARSFRYGSTRRHVLSLRVAFMDGTLRTFARGDAVDFPLPSLPRTSATKNTAGFPLRPGMDWVDLFIGSEGTLGVVTEARLQLLPRVHHLLTGVVFFQDDGHALDAVDAWRGVASLRMLEYMDGASLDLLRPRYPELPDRARSCLLYEQELDSPQQEHWEVEQWLHRLEAAAADVDGSWCAGSDADRERFRRLRHALPETVNNTVRRNGFSKLGSDYAVPLDRNREMLSLYHGRLEREFAGRYVVFGHIGDAHVHVNILPATEDEFGRGKELLWDLAREAVRLGGTVSAEHGLGKRKADLLKLQYTPEQIEAMRNVKRRMDPDWLLGRGNVFPG